MIRRWLAALRCGVVHGFRGAFVFGREFGRWGVAYQCVRCDGIYCDWCDPFHVCEGRR